MQIFERFPEPKTNAWFFCSKRVVIEKISYLSSIATFSLSPYLNIKLAINANAEIAENTTPIAFELESKDFAVTGST